MPLLWKIPIKAGNWGSIWFRAESKVKLGCVLCPSKLIIFIYFVTRNTVQAMGKHGIKWQSKTLLSLDFILEALSAQDV